MIADIKNYALLAKKLFIAALCWTTIARCDASEENNHIYIVASYINYGYGNADIDYFNSTDSSALPEGSIYYDSGGGGRIAVGGAGNAFLAIELEGVYQQHALTENDDTFGWFSVGPNLYLTPRDIPIKPYVGGGFGLVTTSHYIDQLGFSANLQYGIEACLPTKTLICLGVGLRHDWVSTFGETGVDEVNGLANTSVIRADGNVDIGISTVSYQYSLKFAFGAQ